MTELLFYDAAWPPATAPATDGVMIYAGGDTPHVWTPAEIARQTARWRLPVWVRSNPTPSAAANDAADLKAWLRANGAPRCLVMLDLETAVTPDYVLSFATSLGPRAFVVVYGSSSTLRHNPMVNGYVVALPGATAIPPWAVGCQFAFDQDGGAYDLSWLDSRFTSLLWDAGMPPAPAPIPAPNDNFAEEELTMKPGIQALDGSQYLIFLGAQGLVRQPIATTADVEALEAMGAVPVHFTPATLAKLPVVAGVA